MIRRLPLCITLALASTAHAQPPAAGAEATIPLTYVGANARVSLGINDDGDVLGEILGILGKTDESAWLAELWLGQGGAGGVKFGYNWLRGEPESGSAAVWKVFVAGDQNAFKDRKATLGLGRERDDFFWSAYVSQAASGKRLAGSVLDIDTNQLTGSDANGNWTQTQTIETLTRFFEHPYEHGVGVRFGGYFDDALLRVRGGLDYEEGKFDSDQTTLSLGVDKYFRNSRFSLSLQGEALRKTGDFVTDKTDTRGWLLLRYDLGNNFRAREPFRMVEVTTPASSAAAAPGEPQVVRNEVRMDGDAFFGFDKSTLRPDAIAALDELVAKLESVSRVSRVSVVGHTDSVGTVEYNQRLSERRAEAAKAYLVSRGIPAEQIDTRGEGELNPSFPNDTPENRQKNRRVDVEFLTIEETTIPAAEPEPIPAKVEWVREPVKANPAWIERALRNPAEHKRSVDVYAFQRSTTTETLGPRIYANRPPVAANDTAIVEVNSPGTLIAVLANDSDPDGDALTITAVSTPAHGSATIGAGGITYTPAPGYAGADSFTYTISDGRGGTATATVSITVGAANRPPIAVNDNAAALKGYDTYIDVLGNDSDPDGDNLTITAVEHTGPGNAVITIETGNMIHYQSIPGFAGIDHFTYTVSDGRGGTATATVTVLVWELPIDH
ncbi:MAG TPA: Ig-like domain-containing protein [Dokdonella sp.]|uniref:Ig-like domain-containing protein n=1 Tax=Dokdonella sp. TaxID=2291710 RepID=UPI0025C060A1|nr:Ig-like domain-containing protein [Dokdonella sp.]MBX3690943.1 tandem-95 repeat protein [Dokdonella sp.]MCW5566792.1 tandem-95 repeat protein [Dokdonella sp.]HNR91094.1 Ig-like domain-containing protein [Dokdonella sp.]